MEVYRPPNHAVVMDALDLAGRPCPRCTKVWVSRHGSVWQCPDCQVHLERPVGVDDAVNILLRSIGEVKRDG